MTDSGVVVIGMDVSKREILAGVLPGGEGEVRVHRLGHDEPSVRRFIGRFPDRSRLRVCYEAGPTGYGLFRLLGSMGVTCEVVAPSLIPKRPGERVKTDRRDARRLAGLYRAGELTPIRVPSPTQEAVRDLCRTRADLLDTRKRTRQQLTSMLLRHGIVYGATRWTARHEEWLGSVRFDEPALTDTLAHYRAALSTMDANLVAVETDLGGYYDRPPFADGVHRLAAYRGIGYLGALTLTVEVGDWARFPAAPYFMGFVGLVPSEYSTGDTVWRGKLTKAGNSHLRTQLIESAWAYQHRPRIGVELSRRHQGIDPATLARSWAAQQRLCRRWRHLASRKHHKGTVAAAVARELAGFCWGEMTAEPAPKPWEPPS
ncbi:MAG: IS110 family transposase [Acidimicrobiia bacterium]